MPRHGPLTREDARAILEVSVGATRRVLTAARNRMHKQHHPDRAGGDTRLAQRINEAFDVLLAELPPPPSTGPAEGGVPHARPPAGPSERVQTRSEARNEEEEEEADADEDAEVDASNSETEAEVRPPAGRGVPKSKSKKRKRKAGGARRAEAAARFEPERKRAGYVDRGRRTFRDNQGALATGTKRSCLADALWMALVEAGCEVDLENVRSIMPQDPDADTTFASAQLYVAKFGFELACVSKELQKEKGGYAFNLLLRETGLFLVQLRVTTGKDDRNPPDLHVCFYDGKTVRDNGKYTKVKILEPSDRTKEGARLVFDSLFNGLEVRINNIYELTRA